MNREQFFLVLDKIARVLPEEQQVVVFGSQALHAWVLDLPDLALRSKEVDIAAIDDPEDDKQSRINWVMGEESEFDVEYAVFAEGVSIDLFTAPTGWLQRTKSIPVRRPDGSTLEVLCPEPHDLCVGKLIANREKDEAFVEALARSGVVEIDWITHLLTGTDVDPVKLGQASETLSRIGLRLRTDAIARRAVISGLVQGVWYRDSTRKEADRLGVVGWVRNLPDGRVELHAEGRADAVDALLAWCAAGPPLAQVVSVDADEAAPEGATSFEIR